MVKIRLDADKAERMIAQMIRDDGGLLSAKANALAADIRRRLSLAIPMPTNQPLRGYRIIPPFPPDGGSEFAGALKERIADVNHRVASELWQLVGNRGRDLPATVVDPRL